MLTPITRRRIGLAATGLGALGLAAPRAASGWSPDRPVRIIIPFAAGGASDVLARAAAERLTAMLGQPVVVEARPGAGGNLGAEAAARSAPDGHTIFFGGMSSNAINGALYARLTFDPARDLVPVGMFVGIANVLLFNPARGGFADLRGMLAAARARPGAIAYASNGAGSVTHLTMELLCRAAGVELLHVPYRGGAPASAGLLAGDVALMFDGAPSAARQVRGGTLGALGVSTAARITALPEAPSVAEAGVPGFDVPSWYAMFGPAGMPDAVRARWIEAFGALCAEPAFVAFLDRNAAGVMPLRDAAAMEGFLAAERTRWAAAVRDSGARAE